MALGTGHLSAPFYSQYMARRSASGWQTRSIDPPRDSLTFDEVKFAIRPGLRRLHPRPVRVLVPPGQRIPLAPGTPPGWTNLYRRTDTECGGAPDFETLLTSEPTNLLSVGEIESYVPKVLGFSADGRVAVLAAGAALTPDANPDPLEEGKSCTNTSFTPLTGPGACGW